MGTEKAASPATARTPGPGRGDREARPSHGFGAVSTLRDASRRGERLRDLAQLAASGPAAVAQGQRLRALFGSRGASAVVQRASAVEVAEAIGGGADDYIVKDLAEASKTGEVRSPDIIKAEIKAAAALRNYKPAQQEMLVGERPKFTAGQIPEHTHREPDEDGKPQYRISSFKDVDPGDIHAFNFVGVYRAGDWTTESAFKNPYLASFFASQVTEHHVGLCGFPALGETFTHSHDPIVSDDGIDWAIKFLRMDGPEAGSKTLDLTPHKEAAAWAELLTTVNGKHVVRTGNAYGYTVTGATLRVPTNATLVPAGIEPEPEVPPFQQAMSMNFTLTRQAH